MKNISTGTGIALLAGAIVAFPLLNRISSIDHAAHASSAMTALASAAMAQTPAEPTIVWYSVGGGASDAGFTVWRAWSDGTVEYRRVRDNAGAFGTACSATAGPCVSLWFRVNDPAQGYAAASDTNADEQVDGADLGIMLAQWGPAPRVGIPPSDCPLNLINP